MGAHGLLHVPPGGEDPLAPHALHPVHHTIEDAHTHVGHTDLIGVREGKGHPHPNLGRILLHLAPFPAGVPGGLLNGQQEPFFQLRHTVYTSLSFLQPYCTPNPPELQYEIP